MKSKIVEKYSKDLIRQIENISLDKIKNLTTMIYDCYKYKKQVFLVGNGGSGSNANHIANDFIYPVSKSFGVGVKMHSLVANPGVITCIGNDEGYENIFSYQLAVLAEAGDLLIVLSGSGNSTNIVRCIEVANNMGVKTFSLLGFDGGKCLNKSDQFIHFDTNDMQVCEDMQMFVANSVLKELSLKIQD